jgi:hypothetical protein
MKINQETCYAIYNKTCYVIFILIIISSFFSDVNADNSALDFRTGSVEILSTDTIQLNDIHYDGQAYTVMLQLNSDATWQLLSQIPQPASKWLISKPAQPKLL